MPTLAQAEATLVGPAPDAGAGLIGATLASVRFSATGPSPVAALAPSISRALMACGITPADVTAPGDDDLAALSASDWGKFLDIATFLLLQQAALNMAGMLKTEDWPTYKKERFSLDSLLKYWRDTVSQRWGFGGAEMHSGTIRVRARGTAAEM